MHAGILFLLASCISQNNDELICAEMDGDNIGANIDCSPVCQKVCEGMADCPCNDNGKSITCWVPKAQAHELCKNIKDCYVISTFAGDYWAELPFYAGWAHLGNKPVSNSRGFRAALCDKSYEEAAAGCYGCSLECEGSSQACTECFQKSHSTSIAHEEERYCEAYDGRGESPCAACACCTFHHSWTCGFAENMCFEPKPVCGAEVLDEIRIPECAQWLSKTLLGQEPTIASTCRCTGALRNRLASPMSARYDCKVVDHHLRSLRDTIQKCESVVLCSNDDDCTGCRTHLESGTWKWLSSVNTPTQVSCGYHPVDHMCVVKTSDGVLRADQPCSTRNATLVSLGPMNPLPSPEAPLPPFPEFSPEPSPSTSPTARRMFDEDEDARGHRLTRFDTRLDPINTGKMAPSPSPLTGTYPTSTDLENTTIGNSCEHRHYMDSTNVTVNVVMTCNEIPETGFIRSWSIYSGRSGLVHAQILRETEVPEEVRKSNVSIRAFTIVGQNFLFAPGLGKHTFHIPPRDRIHVQKGDLIGFYSAFRGVVSWSEGGGTILYRYGSPGTPSTAVRGTRQTEYAAPSSNLLLFVGEGTARTYSISCTGKFGDDYDGELEQDQSEPSSEADPIKPTYENNIPPYYLPEEEPVPVIEPNLCHLGTDYWCLNADRMKECSVPEDIWTRACLAPPSPSPPCDPLMQCPEGFVAKSELSDVNCFIPSRDCEASPCGAKSSSCDALWKSFNEATFGNASCPYCLSGNDWTGRCISSKMQSPIKIQWESVDTDPTAMQFFSTHYVVTDVNVTNNLQALVINADFGAMMYDGIEYTAERVVFHAPAEHQIEGQPRSDLEVQIVHKQKESWTTLIISVLYDMGESESQELAKILENPLPRTLTDTLTIKDFNLNSVVDHTKPIVWYDGSLTVPPCNEMVRWGVLMGVNSHLSRFQLGNINSLFKDNPEFANGHGNNRQLQPLNGRRLVLRSNCGSPGAIACPSTSSEPVLKD
eukprot:c9351_g1_i1.p1 GENE.c9351_g1_i1~~c9351_g1_i1.p1  ORF type:complete len:990 (-),score=277.27 c9351_g1_i1:52-3021(-)